MQLSVEKILGRISQNQFDVCVRAGIILAIASSLLYIFFGKILSANDLVSDILKAPKSNQSRKSFVVISGFVFVSALVRTLYYEHIIDFYPFDSSVEMKAISALRLIIGGLLMGFGYSYCTFGSSNEGLFGLPRFTLRSILTTAISGGCAFAFATYKLFKYIPSTPKVFVLLDESLSRNISFSSYLLASILVPFICFLISKKKTLKGLIEFLVLFIIGGLIGLGMMMIKISQISTNYKYLTMGKHWMPNFIVTVSVATLIFTVIYFIIKYGLKKPLFSQNLEQKRGPISFRQVIGSMAVGLGWATCGLIIEGFLLLLSSESIRIVVFWGIPYLFAIKSTQVLLATNTESKSE